MIDVAAAIIERADGRVLLAERPAGKPWDGYWEFPGGKIEHGETPAQALTRELHEELGIDTRSLVPWITRDYAYPEKKVRLHFLRVTRWQGEPLGREGQRLSWEAPAAVKVAPLLPANTPILAMLSLPPIYAITAAGNLGRDSFMTRLDAALARNVRLIQVREKNLQGDALRSFVGDVLRRAHAHGARVLVNGDVELADRMCADGVHLTSQGLRTLTARPELPLVGASCHNAEELNHAQRLGVDFAVLSPVLPTSSHPGEPGLGWARFAELVRDRPFPVYALGGMKPAMLAEARSHGAHGIALLSGIW